MKIMAWESMISTIEFLLEYIKQFVFWDFTILRGVSIGDELVDLFLSYNFSWLARFEGLIHKARKFFPV